jgi:hypothetical protein
MSEALGKGICKEGDYFEGGVGQYVENLIVDLWQDQSRKVCIVVT